MPDYAKDIDSMYARGWRDGKFQYQPEAYNYAMQDLLTYDEFWYQDYRERDLLVDSATGETMEWTGNPESMQEYLSLYPQITSVKQTIPTVKLAILVNGRVLFHGRNPMGIDKYPFIPVFAYYEPQIPYFPWRCQGVVRGLRDAQYLYNRRKIIELDILESQINSGIKYKEGSLINPKDAFLTGQGRSLALKQEAQMDDVQQILPPQIPPSMMQLSESLSNEITQISGVNEELLGSAIDDKAGVLAMLRQGAGLTTLQILFDQLNQSQKYLGEICLELIQANFSTGKVKRIIGEEPTEQFYSRVFQKYDLVVEEGLNTSTQRQMQFAQLMQMREMQLPIPTSVLIDSSTLQNKKQLMEAIQAQEKQAQEADAKAAETEMQVKMATMASLEAKAFADKGLGLERISRVEENSSLAIERLAQAEKERSQSVYEEVKAAKELEHMDLDALHKAVEFLEKLKALHQTKEEEDLKKTQESKPKAVA
jgi:hypothetical protein